MNTTKLIGQWSMEGATRDHDGRLRSVEDVRALFAHETMALARPRARNVFLAKPAGGATWEALHRAAGDEGGGRF
jgi:hypothetical protein